MNNQRSDACGINFGNAGINTITISPTGPQPPVNGYTIGGANPQQTSVQWQTEVSSPIDPELKPSIEALTLVVAELSECIRHLSDLIDVNNTVRGLHENR